MLKLYKKKSWMIEVGSAPVTLPVCSVTRVLRLAPTVSIHVAIGEEATDESTPIFEYQAEEVEIPANQPWSILGSEPGHVWVTEVSRD